MESNIRHRLAAVEATIDSARITDSNRAVFVDSDDVSDALRVISDHSDRTYPDVKAFTEPAAGANRVALKFQ